jgi:2-polyprenyl-3-methyl-5-hydroxy-6-metoxy-1,4-benzoquinol methylase
MTGYFDRARREVLPHLPARCARLLELGCGTGATVEAVRAARAVAWAGGVELDPEAAEQARAQLDRVWEADVERNAFEAEIAPGSLDLVLCLDILEHLVEPWDVVKRLGPLLAPGGRLIVSVPNVRHWRFVWRLLVHGDFRYREAGILDRTHLRFFTRETAAELATSGGLRLVHCGSATCYRRLDARGLLIRASGGRMESVLAKQFLIVAERAGAP